MNINIITGRVTPSPSPLTYSISVPEDFSLSKVIEVQEGDIQKVNENGEKLFSKEVFKTIEEDVVVGQDETLEDTGVPCMISIQKKDSEGNNLYWEPIVTTDGVTIDYVEVTDSEDEDGTPNEPVIVEEQKLSTKGNLVFLKDIIEVVEMEELNYISEVVEETESPIMIPNIVQKVVTLIDNPSEFSVEEIVGEKYSKMLEESQKNFIIADMFLSEEDLDLADPNHLANTGVALLQLLANGQAKTKTITLAEPTTSFELLEFEVDGVDLYLSGKKFVDGKLELTSPVSNCTIKFINTTNKPVEIKSYAIGY